MRLITRVPKGAPTGGQFATQEKAEAPVHLHVGVNAFARPVVASIGEGHPAVSEVIDQGDQWEVWGEKSSAHDHKHLVLEVSSRAAARELAGALEGTSMLQRSQDEHAVAWVVTDPEDWSEVHETDRDVVTSRAARRAGRRFVKNYSKGLAEILFTGR